tara:strand:+ start:1751 stop:1948 length:198 start_codon:yes stop_codon:yes gene_type:complete
MSPTTIQIVANKSKIATTNLSRIIFNLLFSFKGAIGKGNEPSFYFGWYSVITGIAEQLPKKLETP